MKMRTFVRVIKL